MNRTHSSLFLVFILALTATLGRLQFLILWYIECNLFTTFDFIFSFFPVKDDFVIQCRVTNKPYDFFGTWYNDSYLLSGDLRWLAHLVSTSIVWLNRASQEADSELTAVMNRMFKFYNRSASSIRSITVANCLIPPSPASPAPSSSEDKSTESPDKVGFTFILSTLKHWIILFWMHRTVRPEAILYLIENYPQRWRDDINPERSRCRMDLSGHSNPSFSIGGEIPKFQTMLGKLYCLIWHLNSIHLNVQVPKWK